MSTASLQNDALAHPSMVTGNTELLSGKLWLRDCNPICLSKELTAVMAIGSDVAVNSLNSLDQWRAICRGQAREDEE